MCKIIHNSVIVHQISSKFDAEICLWTSNKCSKFQPDWKMHLRGTVIFVMSAKRQKNSNKKTKKIFKFDCLYLESLKEF